VSQPSLHQQQLHHSHDMLQQQQQQQQQQHVVTENLVQQPLPPISSVPLPTMPLMQHLQPIHHQSHVPVYPHDQ